MRRLIRNILNKMLQVGGHCGKCGRFLLKEIVVPEEDAGWTLCEECAKV